MPTAGNTGSQDLGGAEILFGPYSSGLDLFAPLPLGYCIAFFGSPMQQIRTVLTEDIKAHVSFHLWQRVEQSCHLTHLFPAVK